MLDLSLLSFLAIAPYVDERKDQPVSYTFATWKVGLRQSSSIMDILTYPNCILEDKIQSSQNLLQYLPAVDEIPVDFVNHRR